MTDKKDDTISRQAAIDALGEEPLVWYDGEDELAEREQWRRDVDAIKAVHPAQPDFDITVKIDKAYDDGYEAGYLQGKHDWGDLDE